MAKILEFLCNFTRNHMNELNKYVSLIWPFLCIDLSKFGQKVSMYNVDEKELAVSFVFIPQFITIRSVPNVNILLRDSNYRKSAIFMLKCGIVIFNGLIATCIYFRSFFQGYHCKLCNNCF